ncbi:hypothetical protein DIPPA_04250 [Diplonema papillatum]|nr:hypothetical protein DIPPA_04250 [Diplonema papillatum]
MVNIASPIVLSEDELATLRTIQRRKAEVKTAMLGLKWKELRASLGSDAILDNSKMTCDESSLQEEWDYVGYQMGYACAC